MGLKNLANQVKKQNKELNKSFEELFLESLDKWLVKAEDRELRLAFNPSGYYKCQRQMFYRLSGVPEKKKKFPRSERILAVGTAIHEWVQKEVFMKMDTEEDSPIKLIPYTEMPSFGQEGIEYLKEHQAPDMEIKFLDTRWTEKFPVSAMVDGAMHFNKRDFLFEFKTINPKDFDLLIEPLQDHIKQGAIYALCTGIHSVMFLYICKGTQNWKAYLINYNQDQLDWVIERIQRIERHVLEKVLPEKEVGIHCRYCGFKNICDKDLTEPK